MSSNLTYKCEEVGIFTPKAKKVDFLEPGQVGYIITGIKDIKIARVGDT